MTLKQCEESMKKTGLELTHCIEQSVKVLEEILENGKLTANEVEELLLMEKSQKVAESASGLAKKVIGNVYSEFKGYCEDRLEKSEDLKLLVSYPNANAFLRHFQIEEGHSIVIAGPCAVENTVYLEQVAKSLKGKGLAFIRGGAFKPRTSPYDFQGLEEEGLKMLRTVADRYDLKVVTEVVNTEDVETVSQYADVLQVGARNMQNFALLKVLGKAGHPVLLKRGLSATIEEWIYAAEYLAKEGNQKILMCERGIRTYETKTRNTLDISSVAIVKQETNLPVMVDLSHSLGRKDIIIPVGKAALAVGACGIMVEVHPRPELALSDRNKQLSLEEFDQFMNSVYPEGIRNQERECILISEPEKNSEQSA